MTREIREAQQRVTEALEWARHNMPEEFEVEIRQHYKCGTSGLLTFVIVKCAGRKVIEQVPDDVEIEAVMLRARDELMAELMP